MAQVTISGGTIQNYQGASNDLELRAYSNGFFDSDGNPIVGGSPNDLATIANFYEVVPLTIDEEEGALTYPSFTLPSTTDSQDRPGDARWGLFIFDSEKKRLVAPLPGLESFQLEPTPSPVALSYVRTLNTGALPAELLDVTITGDLDVSGDVTATNFFGNGAGLTGITGATGGVSNTGSTTIAADTDNNGVGIISFQTGGVERLALKEDYLVGRAIETATGSINTRQFGAVPDEGGDDMSPFLSTLNALMSAGRAKTIRLPAGITDISSTLSKTFSATYNIVFQGDGSGSIIRINPGELLDGIVFNGGNSIVFRDITFIGIAGAKCARYALRFIDANKVRFENCNFYGLTTDADNIHTSNSFLEMEGCQFFGCSASGDEGAGVITCDNWRGVRIFTTIFYDQGKVNNVADFHSLSFPAHWIKVGRPHTTLREEIVGTTQGSLSGSRSQGVFRVESCVFDEGAGYSIVAFSDVGGGAPAIEHVELRYNRHNITNAGGAGINLQGTASAHIYKSWFGYTYLADTSAIVLGGAGDVVIEDCLMEQRARQISVIAPIGGTTSRVTVIDGDYATIYLAVDTLLDIQRGGKRKLKPYPPGNYSYAALAPNFEVEYVLSVAIDGNKIIGQRGAAVAAPSGGAVVDVEARAALVALIERLSTHGLIDT